MPSPANLSAANSESYVRFEKQLSASSIGSIWLGRLLNGNDAGRTVLLRRIAKQWLSSKDAEWVQYGATAYASVRHPSLVKLLGILEQGDDLLSVSEHLEGVRLVDLQRTVFTEGVPIPATVAVRIVLDAARATWNAHRLATDAGIFPSERVCLPEGIFVASYGGTLLTEIGVLAALSRCVVPRTVPDLLAQLAPEELGGKSSQPGSPEVFSLGVVLWELLANRWLFSRESDSRTHQELLLSTVPGLDRVERFGMPVPDDIVALVRRATSRDRAQRYASVNELVLALESLPAQFIASEQQVAEVLRLRTLVLLKESKVEESKSALSGTFAGVRSTNPSLASPSSHDWDRPTFAQSSLVTRTPLLAGSSSFTPVVSTSVPKSLLPAVGFQSVEIRQRRRGGGLLLTALTMLAVFGFILAFKGVPERVRFSSPAPAAAVAPRPAQPGLGPHDAPNVIVTPREAHVSTGVPTPYVSTGAPTPSALPVDSPRAAPSTVEPEHSSTAAKVSQPAKRYIPRKRVRPQTPAQQGASSEPAMDSRWGI